MTNSALDHGYGRETWDRSMHISDHFRLRCALGVSEYKVLRPHSTPGHYECVMTRWITEVPEFRQSRVGSIQILPLQEILDAIYAD